jgi:hypothetical protein
LSLFEAELRGHPDRDSAVDLYRHMLDLAQRTDANDHEGLVGALDAWLKQRSEPRTMIAVDIAGKLKLTELQEELGRLLDDVCANKAFLPHYTRWINEAIQAMS